VSALPSIPPSAVVYVKGSIAAHRLRRRIGRERSQIATSRLSIMWGENGWLVYARGMAKLSGRPFIDLRRAA
jgi:hypothetical protein